MARLDMQTMKDVLVKKIDISEIKTVYDIGCLNGADSFLLSELFNNEQHEIINLMKK